MYKISEDTLQAVLDFAITNTPLDKTIEISLFGGEPLFYRQQVQFAVEYMKQVCLRPFRFFAITNGVNLTQETLQIFNDIDWFMLISLDGPYEVSSHMPRPVYDRIISNILSIPLEKRQKHIGLKATLSDETIEDIRQITDFLFSLQTSIVYLSPTMEIDHERIKVAVKQLSREKLILTRDGRLLDNLTIPEPKLDLMFKKEKIFLRGGSQPLFGLLPVGWCINQDVSLSDILIAKAVATTPFLPKGQQGLVPENLKDCETCPLNGVICSPQPPKEGAEFLQTQCIWNKAILEALNETS